MTAVRTYSIPMADVSISLVQDLWSVLSTANMAFELHYGFIGCRSATTVENLDVSIKRFTGGFSQGSAGSSVTPVAYPGSQAAATVTAHVNDTSRGSGGSNTTLGAYVLNEVNGLEMIWAPEDRFVIRPSEMLMIGLETAPGSAKNFFGYIIVGEIF